MKTKFFLDGVYQCSVPYPILNIESIQGIHLPTQHKEYLYLNREVDDIPEDPYRCSIINSGDILWKLTSDIASVEKVNITEHPDPEDYDRELVYYNHLFRQ